MKNIDKDSVQQTAENRTKVAKNPRTAILKDRLLLAGMIGVCVLIGITSLLPKHKSHQIIEQDEKQDTSQTLSQNMELIAKFRDNKQASNTGYHGSNPNYPPQLRAHPDSALTKETLARMNAPSTFFSISGGESGIGGNKDAAGKTLTGHDANSEFLNQQSDIASVSAKQLPHPALTVPAGEMIPATLETAINSELAGMARAITTRDVYALSGNKLLIPKGSTLVGQFNAAITQGQSRIFVVWNRVQLTNGVIVTLNSPSTDAIGRSGQGADYIDRHFFERFGTGVLLSVLGAYTATGGVNGQDEYNSIAQYRMNIASSFQQASNQTLQQDMLTHPTLQVNQGATINVFVANDLDFYRVAGRI